VSLRKEVIHRLPLAKSILIAGQSTPLGQPNPHYVRRQVLNAHDAADLVFAAITDHQRKLPPTGKAPSMMESLALIESKTGKHAGYFKQLNDARNSLKHVGNLPNTNQWSDVTQEVFAKLSELCRTTLRVSLGDVDESELLLNNEARSHLAAAKAVASVSCVHVRQRVTWLLPRQPHRIASVCPDRISWQHYGCVLSYLRRKTDN